MIGEYGALLGTNGFLNSLVEIPSAFINFLHTTNGQLSAAVLAVVLLLLFRKR